MDGWCLAVTETHLDSCFEGAPSQGLSMSLFPKNSTGLGDHLGHTRQAILGKDPAGAERTVAALLKRREGRAAAAAGHATNGVGSKFFALGITTPPLLDLFVSLQLKFTCLSDFGSQVFQTSECKRMSFERSPAPPICFPFLGAG